MTDLTSRLQLVRVWSDVFWLPEHGHTRVHQSGQVPPRRQPGPGPPAHHQDHRHPPAHQCDLRWYFCAR